MAQKERLDTLLVEKGFFPSRSQAKRAIMAGKVFVNGVLIDKAGTPFIESIEIYVKGGEIPYVSRGGFKLEKAFKVFSVDPQGKEAIDIGASTGGFTDCLLQNGAVKVYAIDVGYGQLAWKLRQDKRVVTFERTNFRYLTQEDLSIKVPLIVSDVSFISLRLIIPTAVMFLEDKGDIIALIKPQFEAGPEKVGKNGVVKDKEIHSEVLRDISVFFDEQGLCLRNLDYSPITGAASNNIEFLIHLSLIKTTNDLLRWEEIIDRVVKTAHQDLEGR